MYPVIQHVGPVQPSPPHWVHSPPQFPGEDVVVVNEFPGGDVGVELVVGLVTLTITSAQEL